MHAFPQAGFRRQVVVRLDAEDWALLEAATKEHGSQQAALIAALRALGGSSPPAAREPSTAQAAPAPAEAPEPDHQEVEPEQGNWWIAYGELEPRLGLKRAALKRRIAQSGAETRYGARGEEVRLDQVEVDAPHAAGLMGVSLDTARRRARAGEMEAISRPGGYFFPLGKLEVNRRGAGELLGADSAALQAMIDRGSLTATGNGGPEERFRVLDVISLIE